MLIEIYSDQFNRLEKKKKSTTIENKPKNWNLEGR